MGRYNLLFVLCTNSTKRTLVKDLHFIGPKLSHLIKLTVTERATQGQRGCREIGWCQTCVTPKCTFHSVLTRRSFQAGGKKRKKKKKSRPQRQQTRTLNTFTAVENQLQMTDLTLQSGSNVRRNTLDFNDGREAANEQVKTSSVESGMNTLARADR